MNMETQAFLPASKIATACRETIKDIREDRGDILYNIVESERIKIFGWKITSYAETLRKLPDDKWEIPLFHRADEENLLKNLLHMSMAAEQDSPDICVAVALNDFSFIANQYREIK